MFHGPPPVSGLQRVWMPSLRHLLRISLMRDSKNPLITWAGVAPQFLHNNGGSVTDLWQEIALPSPCVLLIAGLCSPEPSYIFRAKESELKSSRRGELLCTVLVTTLGRFVAHKEKFIVCREGRKNQNWNLQEEGNCYVQSLLLLLAAMLRIRRSSLCVERGERIRNEIFKKRGTAMYSPCYYNWPLCCA
jgi:hypothetical protein